MWRLRVVSADQTAKTWEIEWTTGRGLAAEDLLDGLEDSLKELRGDVAELRILRWSSGPPPEIDSTVPSMTVSADEVIDSIHEALITIAGTPQERVLVRVTDAAPAAELSVRPLPS